MPDQKSNQKNFTRSLYLIDKDYSRPSFNLYMDRTLEDYASEMKYWIVGNLMKEYRRQPQMWNFDILRDDTPESLQLAYRLLAGTINKSMNIIDSRPKDLEEWYNKNRRASQTLVILADADRLNLMGSQILAWKSRYPKDEVMVNEFHNYHISINGDEMYPIPKFSNVDTKRSEYIDLQSRPYFPDK